MDLINKTLGSRYEILEQIGIGGMAVVYKAKCKLLNRFVAVKILKQEFSKDAEFVKRFRAEAQSAASLTHPNIVSVYDVGEENGVNYIVMELLNGDTLKDEIERKGKFGNELTLKFASQIASALEAAHMAKIVHRDIKPQNIVLTSNNTIAKVTDFGIAKMSSKDTITSSSNTIGSVHYFSPEHAKGCFTDAKSDIYSLGVVMYEMATGKLPFNADTPVSVALKQIQEDPIQPIEIEPSISLELNTIILKAMAKPIIERYQSASEMLDDIFAAINSPKNLLHGNRNKQISREYETRTIPIIGVKDDFKPTIASAESSEYISSRKAARLGLRNIKDPKVTNIDTEINKEKKKKILKMSIISGAAILTIIFGILIGSLIKNISNNKNKNKIDTAPNLIGQNYEEIKIYYENLGLNISLNRYENSSDIIEGGIISQDVLFGEKLTSNEISVIVSKGTKKVTMTDVVRKDYTVAKYELESLGLIPEFEFKINDTIAKNIIISQDTPKGTEIDIGSKIKIIVSDGNGKKTQIVPNLIGTSYATAKLNIEKLNLKVGSISYKSDTTKSDGVIISQSVKENSEIEEGTSIDLVINRLQKSKSVIVNMEEYLKESTKSSVQIKVTATIEGVTNTIYTGTMTSPFEKFDVTVNGFSQAIVYVYIDGSLVDTINITF